MSRSRRRTRDSSHITNSQLRFSQSQFGLTPYDLSRQYKFDFDSALRSYEDRRTFHPEGSFRPAASFNRPRHRLVVSGYPKRDSVVRSSRNYRFNKLSSLSGTPAHIMFERPRKVVMCVRRQMRREVLHAYRKTGRGGQRRPRWNWYSRVRCK